MSLYRKYRPQAFADVYGQDHVITTLERASEQGKLAHAYLFAGTRGTGKTSVARILAKILMIQGIEDEVLEQQIVKGVEEGTIVDLLEIDAASNRGIDDVRELIEKIQFSPVVAAAKVYIIDEVHMLTKEAFNALLKTLEEPPPYAYFILATTELNKVPITIQSRCQCFPFRQIREEDIVRRLQYVADHEKISIDREALRAIAHNIDGSMRDALSLLDQLRSLENITLEDVMQRIGATGKEHVEELFEALEQNDQQAVIACVRKVEEAGIPLDVFTRHLLNIIRSSLHTAAEEKSPTSGIIRMLNVLLEAIRGIRTAPAPGLVLEAALLELCSSEDSAEGAKKSITTVKKTKEKEEAKATSDDASKKTEDRVDTEEPESATEDPSETKEAAVEAMDVNLESVQEVWSSVVSQVSPASVKMSLKNGRVHSVEDDTITIHFASSFHRDKVKQTEASRSVEDVLQSVFKRHLKLHCTLEQEGGQSIADDVVNIADAAAEVF